MRELIRQETLEDNVKLMGLVSFEEAQEEIASADVGLCLFLPTPNHLNSLPNKLLEYSTQELAVVASDFECWRAYVSDIGAGVQVDPARTDKIADAVEELLGDRERLRQMGRRGREAVESRYCWEMESHKLLDFYDALLAGR
jgi:glycosyltransferase involved in cell wall biosynthesis